MSSTRQKVRVLRVTKDEVRKNIPGRYMSRGGINPYYLPIFGKIFWRRLDTACSLLSSQVDFESKLIIGDFGCCFGIFMFSLSKLLPKSKIIGLDIYPQELKYAQKWHSSAFLNTAFISGDIQNLPFKKSFDIIFSLDVLEHVPDPIKALQAIKMVLKDNGLFVVSVPIEPYILRAVRFLYFKGKKVEATDPHWHGNVKSFKDFQNHLAQYFEIIDRKYAPLNLLKSSLNYDRIYLCKKL